MSQRCEGVNRSGVRVKLVHAPKLIFMCFEYELRYIFTSLIGWHLPQVTGHFLATRSSEQTSLKAAQKSSSLQFDLSAAVFACV